MSWELVVAKPAEKSLLRLPTRDRDRIEAALRAMLDSPFAGDVVRLKGLPVAWRRRVGSYRVFFDVYPDRTLIVVTAIVRRTSTTY